MSNENAQKVMNNGISLPGEPSDKCCWFIPLNIGVIIIGIGMIATAASNVLAGLATMGEKGLFIYGVLELAAQAPILLGAYYYIMYFMDMENAEKRDGLFRACLMVLFSSVLTLGVQVVSLVLGVSTFEVVLHGLIQNGLASVLYLYFAGTCKKYAEQ